MSQSSDVVEEQMFVGHIGMGLALKRAEPRLNLGALIFCSLFHLRVILKTVVDLVRPNRAHEES